MLWLSELLEGKKVNMKIGWPNYYRWSTLAKSVSVYICKQCCNREQCTMKHVGWYLVTITQQTTSSLIKDTASKKQETEIHNTNTKQRTGPQWTHETREAWKLEIAHSVWWNMWTRAEAFHHTCRPFVAAQCTPVTVIYAPTPTSNPLPIPFENPDSQEMIPSR